MAARPNRPLLALVVLLLITLTACQGGSTSSTSPGSTSLGSTAPPSSTAPPTTASGTFDDHTVDGFATVEELLAFSQIAGTQAAVKFAIPDLAEPGVVWLDSGFYSLHDEWYWFRLLNGERVPGLATNPAGDSAVGSFATIAEVYTWARQAETLPLDLEFAADGERLYSNTYYDLALRDPDKTYGLGTLIRFETEAGDRWVVETEYSEATTPASVANFIDRVSESLPAEIADQVEWVVRSSAHEATAQEMIANDSLHADRIVYYSDLVPQGEVAVYNEAITAGRLRLIEDPEDLNDTDAHDILVMESVPDWLPPAAAMLTSAPQTPLAHVNILARNRGIPNASVAGLLQDPAIEVAARFLSYAVVETSGADGLAITLISEQDYRRWAATQTVEAITVPSVDLESTPITMSLSELAADIEREDDVAALRPIIGGKSAGFLALLDAQGVSTPDVPLAITVVPYFRHLETVEAELDTMLANAGFQQDPRIRFLLLEGAEEYAEVYPSDAEVAENFDDLHPDGPIRTILDADGFMNLFRDQAMSGGDLGTIEAALRANFAALSPDQGLRFRSSSSVEDIEGFTGAGLYDSNTGFYDPESQSDSDDHNKTIERAIKKTWASYWSFEAFEERRLEQVEHRSGGMAITVHPRFDDPLEQNNGVAVLTLNADGSAEATINVQFDDESVANPDGEVLPEQIAVMVTADGALSIDWIAASTMRSGEVLDDLAVEELVAQLLSVTALWQERLGGTRAVTLDFEFKTMAAGWPAMANGAVRPARLVLKQARTLDSAGAVDEMLADLLASGEGLAIG